MIPFGEYLPDLPAYMNTGTTVAQNVVPLTPTSYGPFNNLVTFTAALDTRCQGALGFRDPTSNSFVFAGTADKLYKMGTGSSFTDVSKPGGYVLGADAMWQFVQYGSRVMAFAPFTNPQSFVMGSSSAFADLAAGAPQARYAAIIRDFTMVGNTYDPLNGAEPSQVWWSAINDPTNWPVLGTSAAQMVQSDSQILADAGEVMGILGAVGGADGAIVMERAIYRVSYEGPPTVFRFDQVEHGRGSVVPGSCVNVGSFAFYLGYDGFYAFDGANSIPIGNNKIDKTFYKDFDQSHAFRVVSAVDVLHKLVFWAYPGAGNTGGNPNKVLCYNWDIGRWSLIEMELETYFKTYSIGYTLDQLDAFGTLETLPYSLDSRIWTGGSILMGAFDLTHKMGYFTGSTLQATLETGDIGGNTRTFVAGIRPYTDADDSTVTASLGVKDVVGNPESYTAASPPGVDGVCPQRISSRYVRAQVNIEAGATWTHAQGVDALMQADGER